MAAAHTSEQELRGLLDVCNRQRIMLTNRLRKVIPDFDDSYEAAVSLNPAYGCRWKEAQTTQDPQKKKTLETQQMPDRVDNVIVHYMVSVERLFYWFIIGVRTAAI